MNKNYIILFLSLILFIPEFSFSQGGPVLNVVPQDVLCPGTGCQQVAKSLIITAAPGTMIDGASVYIYSGYVSGQDVLSFTPQFGVVGNFNAATGVLTLNGTATAPQYQQILQSVCYSNLSASPTTGYRTIFYVLGALLYNPVNNHYYQYVASANNITWTAAKNAAAATNYLGMQGYMVTITDSQENAFLLQLINAYTWIGASDAAQSGTWRWVTGCEGLEDGGLGRHFSDEVNFTCLSGTGTGVPVGGYYENWEVDEPNDCNGNESYIHFWYFGKWNDFADNGNVNNYIIEYGCMPNDPIVQTYDSISVYINDSIPAPTLSNNMPVCDGDTIQLSLTGSYTPLVTYLWSGPNTFSSTVQNPLIPNVTQTVNGNYVVNVMDSGCTSTASININQPPPISSVLDSIKNVSCKGGSNGIIYQNGTNGTPGYNYLWNNGQNSASGTGLTAGDYTVTITDANGCTGTSSFTVTEPTLLTSSIASTTNVSCKLNDGIATVTASGGTPGYTYLWSNGQNLATATGLFVGIYTITVTDANNCTSTATASLTSIPSVNTITIANPLICVGQAANLSIGGSGGVGPYSYLWSTTQATTSVSVNPVVTSNYTVTVTDANNCTASYIYTVTVNPVLSISSISNDTIVCKGKPANVSVNVTGGNGNYTYSWSNGSGLPAFSITPLNTITLYVVVTDNCGSPAKTDSVKITVEDYPVVDFDVAPVFGCMPLDVTFNDLSTASPGSVYLYDFGDNGTSVTPSPTYTYIQSGTFDVTLTITTTHGCSKSVTKVGAVDVYPRPAADFSYSPIHPNIFFNNVDFTDLTSGVVNQWLWNFGDSSNTNVQNASHAYADSGTYTVTLIVNNDYLCSDTIIKILRVDNAFSFYVPNAFTPNNDSQNDLLNVQGFNYDSFDFMIYNRWGQLIHEAKSNPVWDGKDDNGNELPEGVYIYYIKVYESFSMFKHEYRGTVTILK